MMNRRFVDLKERVYGYTHRALLLFTCGGLSCVILSSLFITWFLLSKEDIFLFYIYKTLFHKSLLIQLVTFPALNLMYGFGYGASVVGFFCLFLAYIVFKRRSFSQEWDRLLAFILLFLFMPALMQCYSVEGTAFLVVGGHFSSVVGGYVFSMFDELLGILFLQMSCLIAFLLLSRFMYVSSVSKTIHGISSFFMHKRLKDKEKPEIAIGYASPSEALEEPVELLVEDQANQIDNDIRIEVETVEEAQEDETLLSDEGVDGDYELPESSLFRVPDSGDDEDHINLLQERAAILEDKLHRFGINGKVITIKPGPVVTLFEYQPEVDSKISKIIALEDDLALALKALSIRIIAPIPGKSVVGFEVANKNRRTVFLSKSIASSQFQSVDSGLPLILGEDTTGKTVIVDLTRMPHLLIAGSTGSGKSVTLNSLLVSLLCKHTPEELRLVLIDPKRLEFAPYADIAHLLFPIVTESKRVAPILRWLVQEMEKRYEKMAQCGVRNILDYTSKVKENDLEPLPYIVVVIDELADLMMFAGKDVEDLIARIAQMARAAGIHMIVATQRPSVDVVTGIIKVNFPSRISFRVTSKVDSRTILDCIGAEKLLGNGDMLFLNSGDSSFQRVHGAYVSDKEIQVLVDYIRNQRKVDYEPVALTGERGAVLDTAEEDQLYTDVKEYLHTIEEISISLVQRKFRIGYNRSARIIEMLESDGLILTSQGGKTRKVVRN